MIQDPDLATERSLWRKGHRVVAGVDEVGRGAWAGPLTVGVALVGAPEAAGCGAAGCRADRRRVPPTRRRVPPGLRDSKMLAEARREEVFDVVTQWCTAWAVGHVEPAECDELGMTAALRLAAARAFAALPNGLEPDAVVVDGPMDFVTPPTQGTLPLGPGVPGAHEWWSPEVRTEVDGDARCASVAAASVLAKVTRDRIMREQAAYYPAFDFDRNKGYPSPSHQRALCGYGLTALHRRSWAFAFDLPWRPSWSRPRGEGSMKPQDEASDPDVFDPDVFDPGAPDPGAPDRGVFDPGAPDRGAVAAGA